MTNVTLNHIQSVSNHLIEKLIKIRDLVLHTTEEHAEADELLSQLIKIHDQWMREQPTGSLHKPTLR